MPILFTALILIALTIALFQRISVKYAYDGKMSIEISYLVFTLRLSSFKDGKRAGRLIKHIKRFFSVRSGTKYLISHSDVVLKRAYRNDKDSTYALMAIRNYGITSALLTFLIFYLRNNAASFTLSDGAVRLINAQNFPKSSYIELTQDFTLLSFLIALLMLLREKIKKRRLSYGRK